MNFSFVPLNLILKLVSFFGVYDVDLVAANSDETLMGAEYFFPSEE